MNKLNWPLTFVIAIISELATQKEVASCFIKNSAETIHKIGECQRAQSLGTFDERFTTCV